MQVTTISAPQLGEWYSRQELFDAFPGYWVLLAFPNELTPEEGWDIMNTRGVLLAMDANHDDVWQVYRRYKAEHPQTPTYFFATEQEDDIALVAGITEVLDETKNGVDAHSLAHAGESHTQG